MFGTHHARQGWYFTDKQDERLLSSKRYSIFGRQGRSAPAATRCQRTKKEAGKPMAGIVILRRLCRCDRYDLVTSNSATLETVKKPNIALEVSVLRYQPIQKHSEHGEIRNLVSHLGRREKAASGLDCGRSVLVCISLHAWLFFSPALGCKIATPKTRAQREICLVSWARSKDIEA